MKFINHNGKRWSQEFIQGYNVISPCIHEGWHIPAIRVFEIGGQELVATYGHIGALKLTNQITGRELDDYSDMEEIIETTDWSKTITPSSEQTIEEYMYNVFKPTYIASYDPQNPDEL